MSAEAIWSQIRYYENLISSYNSQIRGYKNQQDELEAFKGKFSSLQTKFESKQAARKSTLAKFLNRKSGVSIFDKYYAGMSEIVTGNAFTNADGGLTEAQSKIRNETQNIQYKIDDLYRKINSANSQLSYLHNQLAILAAQE